MSDTLLRFLFDNTDVRGQHIRLGESYRSALENHPYPAPVANLLGELLAAASLMATTIKFEGSLILQARTNGPIRLIMAECTHDQKLRGIARYDAPVAADDFRSLLADGTLALSIMPKNGERYQGIVPLDGHNLAECLSHYFAQSEQLPTRFWLAADGQHASGLLLQELPASAETTREERAQQWQHLETLADTCQRDELLNLEAETLLHRLYHQEPLRIFPATDVRFECSCSRERTEESLIQLGREELMEIIKENGEVTVECQFCHANYRFDEQAVEALLQPGAAGNSGNTLH